MQHSIQTIIENIPDKLRKFSASCDAYWCGKELVHWMEKSNQLTEFLADHNMHVAIVTGEANIQLFSDDLYIYLHSLAHALNFKPLEHTPRISFVAGPVLNVSDRTGRSTIVELYREGFLNLFFSPYRQAVHYQIASWKKGEKTGEEEVYLEMPHSPIQLSYKREQKLEDWGTNCYLVERCINSFDSLIDSGELVHVQGESDLENFLFLTPDEIKSITEEVIRHYGREAFAKENEGNLNRDCFVRIMDDLNIKHLTYPEKIDWNEKIKEFI